MKTLVEFDPEFLSRIEAKLDKLDNIDRALQRLKITPPVEEMLTAHEFMRRIKASRWIFNELLASGKLKTRKVGRKFFVPESQVARYFSGELTTTE